MISAFAKSFYIVFSPVCAALPIGLFDGVSAILSVSRLGVLGCRRSRFPRLFNLLRFIDFVQDSTFVISYRLSFEIFFAQ